MQDPSFGVPPPLLPHVHLISSTAFPSIAHLDLPYATQWLLAAPRTMRDAAPVAWTYLDAPPDGSIFLTWEPPRRQGVFATDGYIYADVEAGFRSKINGYTVEMFVHKSGFKPGYEGQATHARHRFHLVGKDAGVPGPNIDPNLWIIHYGPAQPDFRYPANRINTPHEIQMLFQGRRQLEAQGKLHRQEFMLHDRASWPTINIPNGFAMQPMARGPMPGQPFFTQPPPGAAAAGGGAYGQPPAKRLRQAGPAGGPPGPGGMMTPSQHPPAIPPETLLELAEDSLVGDAADMLTPQDISAARYAQHTEWMEEIFDSPYATTQIVPIDLGQGLMGELAGLTKGYLETPQMPEESERPADMDMTKVATGVLKKLDRDQLEAFEKQVQKHLDAGERELQRMREQHAKRLTLLRPSRVLAQAERRLRDARLDTVGALAGNPTGSEIWRVEGVAHPPPQRTHESVDTIEHDVENTLNRVVRPKEDLTCISKGPLIEKPVVVEPTPPPPEEEQPPPPDVNGSPHVNGSGPDNMFDPSGLDGDEPGASLLDDYTHDSDFAAATTTSNDEPPLPAEPTNNLEAVDVSAGLDLGLGDEMELDESMVDLSGGQGDAQDTVGAELDLLAPAEDSPAAVQPAEASIEISTGDAGGPPANITPPQDVVQVTASVTPIVDTTPVATTDALTTSSPTANAAPLASSTTEATIVPVVAAEEPAPANITASLNTSDQQADKPPSQPPNEETAPESVSVPLAPDIPVTDGTMETAPAMSDLATVTGDAAPAVLAGSSVPPVPEIHAIQDPIPALESTAIGGDVATEAAPMPSESSLPIAPESSTPATAAAPSTNVDVDEDMADVGQMEGLDMETFDDSAFGGNFDTSTGEGGLNRGSETQPKV